MPRYDFKCPRCGVTFESVVPYELMMLPCIDCTSQPEPVMAERQLCFPARIHIH